MMKQALILLLAAASRAGKCFTDASWRICCRVEAACCKRLIGAWNFRAHLVLSPRGQAASYRVRNACVYRYSFSAKRHDPKHDTRHMVLFTLLPEVFCSFCTYVLFLSFFHWRSAAFSAGRPSLARPTSALSMRGPYLMPEEVRTLCSIRACLSF